MGSNVQKASSSLSSSMYPISYMIEMKGYSVGVAPLESDPTGPGSGISVMP